MLIFDLFFLFQILMHTKEMVQKVMLSIFIKQQPLKSTPGEIFLF